MRITAAVVFIALLFLPLVASSQSVPGKYPQASTRLLTTADVNHLPLAELRIMRNEIYARHGFIFKKKETKNYFANQKWYVPRYDNVENVLTDIEKKNIQLIKQYEK